MGSFQIAPNSQAVVYLANQKTDGVIELYAVHIEGSDAPIRLNTGSANADHDVVDFQITRNNLGVVYKADQDTDAVNELYAVLITGGTPVKLNPPLPPGGRVRHFLG